MKRSISMRRMFGFIRAESLVFLVLTVLSNPAMAQEGGRPESLQAEETQAGEIEPHVVGGRQQPNPWFVVTVEGASGCTGTIYNRRWILTAAHCIPANWDRDGSGVIGDAPGENPGQLQVDGGPDRSGQQVRLSAAYIYRHPQAKWGEAVGTSDTALIEVNSDLFPETLPNWNFYYTLNSLSLPVLNLDPWPTSTLAPTSIVTVYGYATRWLGFADAVVTQNFDTWFTTGPLNGRGVCQLADSGGPSFWWGGGDGGDRFYHVGITSVVTFPPGGNPFAGTECSHIGTNSIKPWVEETAVLRPRRGRTPVRTGIVD
jgi:hypothetical protein